jgi:outer membrane lipoprotein-sorting protein
MSAEIMFWAGAALAMLLTFTIAKTIERAANDVVRATKEGADKLEELRAAMERCENSLSQIDDSTRAALPPRDYEAELERV